MKIETISYVKKTQRHSIWKNQFLLLKMGFRHMLLSHTTRNRSDRTRLHY